MRHPKLMSENLKVNTFALNAEKSLHQAVVFKDTSSSTLDNSAFIVRSVAKDTTATMRTKFPWINTRESSISVNIARKHFPRHKIEIIIIPATRGNSASRAMHAAKDLTKRVNLSSIPWVIYVKIKTSQNVIVFFYLNSLFWTSCSTCVARFCSSNHYNYSNIFVQLFNSSIKLKGTVYT